MKKLIILFFFTPLLFSCDFFSTSIASNIQRDPVEFLSKSSTKEIAQLAGEPESTNPELAFAIMKVLSDRNDEVLNLEPHLQENILNLTLDTTITMKGLNTLLTNLDPQSKPTLESLYDDLASTAINFELLAILTLLNNATVRQTVSPSSIIDATFIFLLQLVGKERMKKYLFYGVKISDDIEATYNSISGGDNYDAKDVVALTTIVEVLILLSGYEVRGHTIPNYQEAKLLGIIPLKDLGFTKT